MSISTGSICSNRLIRVAVPISGAAVATVAPRAVAARIATVTCALFGPMAMIGAPAVTPALASAVAAAATACRSSRRVRRSAGRSACMGDQRQGFVVEVRQAA